MADGSDRLSRQLKIANRRGLHARASAKFAEASARFDAEIMVAKDDMRVHGTSIMGLMLLAAGIGETITVEATGAEAEAAMATLTELVENKFGED